MQTDRQATAADDQAAEIAGSGTEPKGVKSGEHENGCPPPTGAGVGGPARLRPSSLPAIRQCGSYEAAPGGDDADRGTNRHAALSALAAGDRRLLEALQQDEKEAVEWAHEYIKAHATSAEPVSYERKLSMLDDDFNEIMRGTPDAVAGPDLFDLKWFPADYSDQMAAYVVMRCQQTGFDKIHVHLLYGQTQRPYRYTLTLAKAKALVDECRAKAGQPPTACSYCGWCKHQVTCPEFTKRVAAVKEGREDWALENYHSSQISDPAEMAKALTLARALAGWCASVEHHAKRMAQQVKLPGFILREKRGRKYVTNIQKAFTLSGLPQPQFLSCCDLRFATSKTNPDKKGIEDTFAEFNGIKKAAAKRQLAEKLADCIQTSSPSMELRAENETTNDNQSE